MRDDDDLDAEAAAALARADDLQATSVTKIEQLVARSKERDDGGRPTKAARTAHQALTSPALSSTLASVTLSRSINPAMNTAIGEVERAEKDYRTALATLRALHARRELYEGARGIPRKRAVSDAQPEPEEWKFVREMRARNVPVSAMDQVSEPELDFIAGLFIEKQKDARHRDRAGAWWKLVRAGLLDVSSEAFNEDERAAILAARNDGVERARLAYEALCDLAGRRLDIPPSFAEFALAFAQESSVDDPIGAFERNVSRLGSDQKRADAEKLLEKLGLPLAELRRGMALTNRPMVVSFKEHVQAQHAAAEQRDARHRDLVDLHRPAARQALAGLHDAERQKERETLGADDLGIFDRDAALERLGAYDEEMSLRNASIIRQVRLGTFIEDREGERRRTIDQLAYELAVSPAARHRIAGMGIALPDVADLQDERVSEPIASSATTVSDPVPPSESEADITVPPAPASTEPASATALLPSAQDYGLPGDISPEAAAAYYDIARNAAIAFNDWPESTWPFAKADLSDSASVAAMVREFERVERDGKLNEISQRYLTTLRTRSIVEANDFLIDRYARKIVMEVATGSDFEGHRKDAGFPRPSQWR